MPSSLTQAAAEMDTPRACRWSIRSCRTSTDKGPKLQRLPKDQRVCVLLVTVEGLGAIAFWVTLEKDGLEVEVEGELEKSLVQIRKRVRLADSSLPNWKLHGIAAPTIPWPRRRREISHIRSCIVRIVVVRLSIR